MALLFKYGSYSFNPKPLFTIGKEYIKTPSQMGLGTRYTLTLEGQIIPKTGKLPGGSPQAGLQEVFSGVDTLREAFNSDYQLLSLYCDDGGDPIVSGYPRITSFEVNNASDNYVVRANYTITLELPSLTGSGFDPVGPGGNDFSSDGIISYTDDFTVEFMDERTGGTLSVFGTDVPSLFSVQRNISAQGDAQAPSGTYENPWERAKLFVEGKAGFPADATGLSGLMCPGSAFANNFRSLSVNKTEGTVSLNQTFIALTGGTAYEDFEVNTSQSLEDPNISITVDGTVNGMSVVSYDGCPASGTPKFNNAMSHWEGISGSMFARANAVFGVCSGLSGMPLGTLNPNPLTQTFGYNPIAGTVTYSFTYDNRPAHCYDHAITENITFTETEPNDVFASLTVLGKISGPLLQSIGTIGPRTRELSIEAILPRPTSCYYLNATTYENDFYDAPDAYDQFVLNYASILANNYAQVFVTSSSKTWDPKTGRFNINQSWTVGSC